MDETSLTSVSVNVLLPRPLPVPLLPGVGGEVLSA